MNTLTLDLLHRIRHEVARQDIRGVTLHAVVSYGQFDDLRVEAWKPLGGLWQHPAMPRDVLLWCGWEVRAAAAAVSYVELRRDGVPIATIPLPTDPNAPRWLE